MTDPTTPPVIQIAHSSCVSLAAVDKRRGLTLDDLARFLGDAHRCDFPGDTPIRASVGFRGQLQAIEART